MFICLSDLMLNTGVEFLGEFSSLVDPNKKRGGGGALTHTKVIIVWPYLAKSSSCGWSSPVHLPTKWGEKKTLMMMMMMMGGSAMTKSFIHILFILYRPSVVSMCLFVLVFFSLWLDFRCVGSATVWDTTTSQGILCSTNRLDFWKICSQICSLEIDSMSSASWYIYIYYWDDHQFCPHLGTDQ